MPAVADSIVGRVSVFRRSRLTKRVPVSESYPCGSSSTDNVPTFAGSNPGSRARRFLAERMENPATTRRQEGEGHLQYDK